VPTSKTSFQVLYQASFPKGTMPFFTEDTTSAKSIPSIASSLAGSLTNKNEASSISVIIYIKKFTSADIACRFFKESMEKDFPIIHSSLLQTHDATIYLSTEPGNP
jgi:hypothetical protein